MLAFKYFSSHVDFKIGDNLDRLQHVIWSPVGHGLVAIANNDIYYASDVSKAANDFERITNDGQENLIFNGLTDWLYRSKANN